MEDCRDYLDRKLEKVWERIEKIEETNIDKKYLNEKLSIVAGFFALLLALLSLFASLFGSYALKGIKADFKEFKTELKTEIIFDLKAEMQKVKE